LVEHCCESPSAHRLDDRRFEQVFRNLFENAVDACQGAVEVTVTCEESAERTRVVVRDNGPGINHREKHHVFEPFYTTKPTGTGLGLAIVKRIVEAHGGVVDVDDGPQPGTAFVIELPHH
jgi:signal transduction histidine kinase